MEKPELTEWHYAVLISRIENELLGKKQDWM